MSRAIKDFKQTIEDKNSVESSPRSLIQLNITSDIEDSLLDIIRSDFKSSEEARDSQDYGIASKGEKITFSKWFKDLKDLYNSRRIPKDTPFKFCSNRSLRIATSILDTLCARLYPAVINPDLLRWYPGESTDTPKVERITKLMNWWIWVRSRLQGFFDIWVKSVAGFGDAITESSWSVDLFDSGQVITKSFLDESGQQILEQDGTPSVIKYRDIKRVEKTESHVYMKDQVYLQKGSRDIQKDPVILVEEIPFRKLLQGEEEGKFVNISNILRMKIPIESAPVGTNPEEAEKLRDIKIRNFPVKVIKWYGQFDSDGDGFSEDVRVVVSLDYDVYLGGIKVSDITKSGRRPLQSTKFSDRFDRPEDLDGEGVLEKVKELSEEIDAIFNQMTDANTLGILRPGFYDPAGNLEAKSLRLSPNSIQPVSDPQRNVFFPDISVQVQHLITAIKLVVEFLERLTAASSEVFGRDAGNVGGSGTATRTNAILQSAETRFEYPTRRLRRGASEIINQHLDLVQLNIPPGLENRILGEKGEPIFSENELSDEGISGEFGSYMLPDPAMGSKKADRELSNMFYSVLIQNPLVGTDPSKIYKVTADLLKSYDKNPEEYLGPAPSTDDIDDPQEENTLLVQGDFKRVRAQIAENHLYHIKVHTDLLQSPSLLFLQDKSPNLYMEVVQATMAHIQEHQQMMQLMMSLMGKFGKGGGNDQPNGGEPGSNQKPEGTPNQQGMEQISGPLAGALNSKRAGESGTPSQG